MSIQTAADQQIASLKNLSAIFSIAIFHLHAYRASAAPGGGSAQLSPYAPIMPHTAPIPHHNRIKIRHQIYANIWQDSGPKCNHKRTPSNPGLIMAQIQTRNVANIIPAYLGQLVGFFWRHTAPKTGAVSGTIQFRQTLASIWYKIGPIRNPQMGKNIMPALPSGRVGIIFLSRSKNFKR